VATTTITNLEKALAPCGTFPHFQNIDDDRRDPNDVIVVRVNSWAKALRVGKSKTLQGAEMFPESS